MTWRALSGRPYLGGVQVQHLLGPRHLGYVRRRLLHVPAQLEFETRSSNQYITLEFQALGSRRFQHGFDRFNLHCPTLTAAASPASISRSRFRFATWMMLSGVMYPTPGPATRPLPAQLEPLCPSPPLGTPLPAVEENAASVYRCTMSKQSGNEWPGQEGVCGE